MLFVILDFYEIKFWHSFFIHSNSVQFNETIVVPDAQKCWCLIALLWN